MATIVDVARIAGVSIKTVSRVFNGEPNVRFKTKSKVLKAASDLGYIVNPSARKLRSIRPNLVALVSDNPNSSHCNKVLSGASNACKKLGLKLILEENIFEINHSELFGFEGLLGVIFVPPISNIEEMILEL